MREIKFRAWDGKRMHEVCRLGLNGFSTDLWSPSPVSCDIRHTKDLTIMEFTGLHDKNGKEIYEGDIVSATIYSDEKSNELEVRWIPCCFVIDYEDSEADMYEIGNFPGQLEVIGNIYDREPTKEGS
jgi:hypothetical protein